MKLQRQVGNGLMKNVTLKRKKFFATFSLTEVFAGNILQPLKKAKYLALTFNFSLHESESI